MEPDMKVIVIEDSLPDVELIHIACESLPYAVELIHFENGKEMFRCFQQNDFPGCSFFLIDLKSPIMDGREVLQALRSRADTALVPAIIFSSSREPEDVRRCMEAGANAYVEKPTNFDDFAQVVERIFMFWGRDHCGYSR